MNIGIQIIEAGDNWGEVASQPGRGGDCGGMGLEWEDSLRPDVRARLEGGALRGGRGFSGEGGRGGGGGGGVWGTGPSLVLYLWEGGSVA